MFGLDKPSRLTIADCVIQNEYGADTNKIISCDRFTTLARLIVEAFPGECEATYYTPSRTRGKGKTASGKLYDTYANLNKALRKVNLRNLRPGREKVPESNNFLPTLPPITSNLGEIEKDIQFLQTYTEPWDVVKKKWQSTSGYRLNRLRDHQNTETTADYISSFPALTQPGAHLLFEYDFKLLYNDAADRLTECWEEFSTKLKRELNKEKIACGNSNAELLYAFPSLFPIISVKVSGRKPWRATRAEIKEGFLVHLKVNV